MAFLRKLISKEFIPSNLVRICFYSTKLSETKIPKVRRNVIRGDYAALNGKDLSFFASIVGENNILVEDLDVFNIDFMRSVCGESKLVVRPGNVEEVSAILRYCNERRLAVCPQGGNTGLVGGSVPVCDEIVLSLQRLNNVIDIDEISGVVACESGCILENLDNKVREKGLIVPLDLGAKSSCHIGGNVSTNAGGLRVLRYGNLHGSVLGVEAVLASGQILDLMSHFKKDNTGYHLKHLFIGSEGTLGVVTKLSILCPAVSNAVHVAFIGISSFDDVLKTFLNAKRFLGEIISSCELIDEAALDASLTHFKLNAPIQGYPFYMLIETSGSDSNHDFEKFNRFLEHGMEKGEVLNGCITGEPGKIKEIWKLRELAAVATMNEGYCFTYDLSLPLNHFYEVVHIMRKRIGDKAIRVSGFGHLGDCNLHLTITCVEDRVQEVSKLIEPFIYEYTSKVKGSISSEHGIGFSKKGILKRFKNAESLAMMKQIKTLLDPRNILNPYKILELN